jgi:multicomponent Na+:H+ antiporter subunit C
MSVTEIFGITAAALAGLGLFGLMTQAAVLRKILAFNILAAGGFLAFGVVAQRGGVVDALPQALVITGMVVAFCATALAIAMVRRLFQITGAATIAEDPPGR